MLSFFNVPNVFVACFLSTCMLLRINEGTLFFKINTWQLFTFSVFISAMALLNLQKNTNALDVID